MFHVKHGISIYGFRNGCFIRYCIVSGAEFYKEWIATSRQAGTELAMTRLLDG